MQALKKEFKHSAEVREYLRLKQKRYRENHKASVIPDKRATPALANPTREGGIAVNE